MALKTPPQIARAAVESGTAKGLLSWDKALVGGFLAGAYIAFGGLVAIAVSSGLKPETWGTLPTLFAGSVFALGLVLVVLAGSELLTGNMALPPIAALRRRGSLPPPRLDLSLALPAGRAARARPELPRRHDREPARVSLRRLLPDDQVRRHRQRRRRPRHPGR